MHAFLVFSYMSPIVCLLSLIDLSGACTEEKCTTVNDEPISEISKVQDRQNFLGSTDNKFFDEANDSNEKFTNDKSYSVLKNDRGSNFAVRRKKRLYNDAALRFMSVDQPVHFPQRTGIIQRRKRCIFSIMAATGVAMAAQQFTNYNKKRKRGHRTNGPKARPNPSSVPTLLMNSKEVYQSTEIAAQWEFPARSKFSLQSLQSKFTFINKTTTTTPRSTKTIIQTSTTAPQSTTHILEAAMLPSQSTTEILDTTITPPRSTKTIIQTSTTAPQSTTHILKAAMTPSQSTTEILDTTITPPRSTKTIIETSTTAPQSTTHILEAAMTPSQSTTEILDTTITPPHSTMTILETSPTTPQWTKLVQSSTESLESMENSSRADNSYVPSLHAADRRSDSGALVVEGAPKYDLNTAIKVNRITRNYLPNGISTLKFTNPISGNVVNVPAQGGDEYVDRKTHQHYLIFVDREGRTLLIPKNVAPSLTRNPLAPGVAIPGGCNAIDDAIAEQARQKYMELLKRKHWGSLVIKGVPKYDTDRAICIMKREKKIDCDGIVVLDFVHPIDGQLMRVPFYGGTEYVEPVTSRTYVVFVDAGGRTVLVFKGERPPTYGMDLRENKVDTHKDVNYIHESNDQRLPDEKWGSVVFDGIPKYDLSNALIITETERKMDEDGKIMLEFEHPITGQKISVPLNGGDEYVMPNTSGVFIIYVDVEGRTLLIFKGSYFPNATWQSHPHGVASDENYGNHDQRSPDEKWGSIEINGKPPYDISRALIIVKTKRKIGKHGKVMLEFEHPITGQRISVPFNGGDEYVIPNTSQVFIICVDSEGRTLLIFKGSYDSIPNRLSAAHGMASGENNNNTNTNSNYLYVDRGKVSSDGKWGSVVINGSPSYDIPSALIIMDTEPKIGKHGKVKLEFEHPITGQRISVPLNGGDEYLMPHTSQVFVIGVDTEGRTLLIFKGSYDSIPNRLSAAHGMASGENNNNTNTNSNYLYVDRGKVPSDGKWGSIVINGSPSYDIPSALIIMDTEPKIGKHGKVKLEFEHPITGQRISVPLNGGDEYLMPHTSQVFVIGVDTEGRTLLIFKGSYDSIPNRLSAAHGMASGENNNNTNTNSNYLYVDRGKVSSDGKWGSIVINGSPSYDIPSALIIMDTEPKIGKHGKVKLEFEHPITGQRISVPLNGGDEYLMPHTSQVFVIGVDTEGRTLLIFKGSNDSIATIPDGRGSGGSNGNPRTNPDDPHGNRDPESPHEKPGWVVRNGIPKYSTWNALIVQNTKRKIGKNGKIVLEFNHPVTGQKIVIPSRGGDEYVDPTTSRTFVIFVDVRGRTLLISKGSQPSSRPGRPTSNTIGHKTKTDRNEEIGWPMKSYRYRPPYRGSVVMSGSPKYDLSAAIIIAETQRKTVGANRLPVLEFVHPETGEKLRIPYESGDEYFDRRTHRLYVIFVDFEGRTYLIYKRTAPSTKKHPTRVNSGKGRNRGGIIGRQNTKFGSIVSNGVPKYDLSHAIFVMETKEKFNSHGVRVIEFIHPITGKIIEINFDEGDEYVIPGTRKVFVIFVDDHRRTLLISKGARTRNYQRFGIAIAANNENANENVNVNRNINGNIVLR